MTSSNEKRKPVNRGPQRIIEKPKNFGLAVKKILKYSKKHVGLVIVAALLACASAVLALIGPNKVGDITNLISEGIMTGIDVNAVFNIGLTLICLYLISGVFNYIQSFIMVGVTQKISKRLRKDVSLKINKLPLKYLDSVPYGDTLSVMTNDIDNIGQSLNNSITSFISNIVLLLGCIIMMFVTNAIMAATAMVSTLIGFIIMTVIMSRSQKYFIAQQNNLGDINAHIEEAYTNHTVVKTYNGQKGSEEEFIKLNKKLEQSAWKSQFLSGLMPPLMGFIGDLGYVAVCVVGALLCSNGNFDIGIISSFIIYVRLFNSPLTGIAQALRNMQMAAASSERVFEFLEEKEMADESAKNVKIDTHNVQGNVEFKNVSFGYNEDKIIISNFSASAKAGQKIAIVGPTGAGKTTLVNLLMRFYEINSGEILIDGVSISDITRENVHDLFSMVLQDTWLFEGTVKENLVYDKENVSDEEIVKVCKTTGVDHFIRTLPKGYDTVLNDNTSISQGQKQLLTISRAMIQNSPMLILDEATSSVDTRTEVIIQEAMDKLTHGRTSFIIAHRLSTIKNADLILVMKDGNVIEKGNHDELMALDGFYTNLYNSQFSKMGAEVIED